MAGLLDRVRAGDTEGVKGLLAVGSNVDLQNSNGYAKFTSFNYSFMVFM